MVSEINGAASQPKTSTQTVQIRLGSDFNRITDSFEAAVAKIPPAQNGAKIIELAKPTGDHAVMRRTLEDFSVLIEEIGIERRKYQKELAIVEKKLANTLRGAEVSSTRDGANQEFLQGGISGASKVGLQAKSASISEGMLGAKSEKDAWLTHKRSVGASDASLSMERLTSSSFELTKTGDRTLAETYASMNSVAQVGVRGSEQDFQACDGIARGAFGILEALNRSTEALGSAWSKA